MFFVSFFVSFSYFFFVSYLHFLFSNLCLDHVITAPVLPATQSERFTPTPVTPTTPTLNSALSKPPIVNQQQNVLPPGRPDRAMSALPPLANLTPPPGLIKPPFPLLSPTGQSAKQKKKKRETKEKERKKKQSETTKKGKEQSLQLLLYTFLFVF